ncbi:uncharacterized protein ACR2FA_012216 [Aphomia sociella]
MGDGLKLTKDKRHRSSSSISGVVIEGTRSERKLDIRVSIPEVDDQFALAEVRCDDLQDKIDLVKVLKRKRKLKKRSTTRLNDAPAIVETVPFLTVRTQPKKTLMVTEVSQQAARLRRLETPQNPTRGYLDPATVEQHRMIGQMHGYNRTYGQQQEQKKTKQPVTDQKSPRTRPRRARADGDYTCGQGVQITCDVQQDVADDLLDEYSDNDIFDQHNDEFALMKKKLAETGQQMKSSPVGRRRHITQETKEAPAAVPEERPVVELYNKAGNRSSLTPDVQLLSAQVDKKNKRGSREYQAFEDQSTGPLEDVTPAPTKKEGFRHPRRVKYRSRRYEMPTVASQMKQSGMRYYYGNTNHTNIPFIVSKSTAPSHNIGVNIQQVLNGLKVQQPLSGIPLTIAHHMGLGHVPHYGSKSAVVQPSLDNREINAIKLGRRLLRLPSYKYISFNRMLALYREGDGMVPRFLRAISRPHYFYTSMYNSLPTNREDFDGATSKGHGGSSQEAKQSLAEYAALYREYEHVDKCIKEGNYEPDLEQRKEELSKELAAREDHIRRVVQEYRTSTEIDQSTLRASASTAEDGYRHSTFKLNLGDPQ